MQPKTENPKIIELTKKDLEVIHKSVNTHMPSAHAEIITFIIEDYTQMHSRVFEKDMTISKFRRMFFASKSEKLEMIDPDKKLQEKKSEKEQVKKTIKEVIKNDVKKSDTIKGHGKNGASKYPFAEHTFNTHNKLYAGDVCPDCNHGTLFDEGDRPVVRIRGRSPVIAEIHHRQTLKCSGCKAEFRAPLPNDITENERTDPTANSAVALFKYGAGFPFYRLAKFQKLFGFPLSASTQWDMVEKLADAIYPVYSAMLDIAANFKTFYIDDTTVKILSIINKRDENKRKGMFTTGIVARNENHEILLFFSGVKHAGENILELLEKRACNIPPPLIMADALSRNFPAALVSIIAKCLIHARRNFVNCAEKYPAECLYVIRKIAVVYKNESFCTEKNKSPEERLRYHRENSAPVMKEIKEYTQKMLAEEESNSSMGQAFTYLTNHWEGLTRFLEVPGCPLDNNIVERLLKIAVLTRKNSLFFKNEHGAYIANVIMSVIQTSLKAGINSFEYLTAIQQNKSHVHKNSHKWLPWNYEETLRKLKIEKAQAA